MNDLVKQGGVAASVVVIAGWVSSRFLGVDVPVEVSAASTVLVAAVGRLVGRFL